MRSFDSLPEKEFLKVRSIDSVLSFQKTFNVFQAFCSSKQKSWKLQKNDIASGFFLKPENVFHVLTLRYSEFPRKSRKFYFSGIHVGSIGRTFNVIFRSVKSGKILLVVYTGQYS